MPEWRAHAGATLLMPSGDRGHHLFVILNEPKTFPGYGPHPCVVLVNLSTIRGDAPYDPTCVLKENSHRFVRNHSYVRYRSARVERVDHLSRGIRNGVFTPNDIFPAETFSLIQAGLRSSSFTKREFKLFDL